MPKLTKIVDIMYVLDFFNQLQLNKKLEEGKEDRKEEGRRGNEVKRGGREGERGTTHYCFPSCVFG